jgi:RNA polymerase subunit RPABC4/transcription elongation factor Spt4
MIHLKTCKKCKKVYDFEKCPFCREKELKKKRGDNGKDFVRYD